MEKQLERLSVQETEKKFVEFINEGKPPFDYGRKLLNDSFSRISAILEGKNIPPYEFEIQPASRCNANCLHCFGRAYQRCEEKLYSTLAIERVMSQILGFNQDGFKIETIKFCGSTGEPLLNPLTLYAINLAAGKKYIRLFTNGIEIGKHRDEPAYIDNLAKVNRINLSLDTATTETLHQVKPGAKESRVTIEDILIGASRVMKRQAKTGIEASFAITHLNYREIVEFAKKIKKYGAADTLRYRIDLVDREVSQRYSDEVLSMLEEVKKLNEPGFNVVVIHSKDEIKQENEANFGSRGCGFKCFTCRFWACLGPDANIYPCGHIVAGDTPSYGNLLEENLSDIWNGEKKKNLIDSLPNQKCEICSPFSLNTNKIGAFLEQTNPETIKRLHDKYILGDENVKVE